MDPYGCCSSYAEHFEKEFEASLSRFGVKVDFRRQSENYRSGKYAKYVIQAVQKRREIFDILDKFRQQVATPEEREAYGLPISFSNSGATSLTLTGTFLKRSNSSHENNRRAFLPCLIKALYTK